jgi:branched-chain amino acid transport system substrate-binding protein
MKRRDLLVGAPVAVGLTVVARPRRASSAQARTVKAGLIATLTGFAAAAGHEMVNGWNLYWSPRDNMVGGSKLVTKIYDDGGNPAQGLNQARRAVEEDGVQMLLGPYLANVGYAIAPYAEEHKVPLFFPTVSADDLSQRKASPYVLKVAGWTSSLPTHPAGVWAYEQGHRKAVTIGSAYAFGYENCGGFCQTFVEHGGKILKQLWAPNGTTDFSPYLSQVRALNADVVFVCSVGADAVHFMEQWSSFGLKDKVPLIGNETLTDQSNIRSMPPEVVEGTISFGHYAEGRDDKITRDFVLKYGKATNQLPAYMAAGFYTAGGWIGGAIEKVNGDLSDTGDFLAAIRAVRLSDSIFGPMYLDPYGSPVENVYIRKVVATSGAPAKYAKTWNVIEKTYPHVSQFWTYNPKQYLKQPVYSDTFQGYNA